MKIRYLILAMILGMLVPVGHHLVFLVKYSVMIMLFFSFLEAKIDRNILHLHHIRVILIYITLPLVIFFLVSNWSESLAQTAFLIAVMPTAAVAPVIMGYLKGRIEFVTVSILITNCTAAIFLPFVLPYILPGAVSVSVIDILVSVLVVIGVPLVLSFLTRLFKPEILSKVRSASKITFYLFVINVYIAISKATQYIRYESTASWEELLGTGLVTIGVSIIYFGAGWLSGGKKLNEEMSMSLGRKNTMFGVWLGLTYFSPLVAVAPMLYIILQNSWHSYLLSRVK